MLSGKAIARALRAHIRVALALHVPMAAIIFDINRPDNNAVDINKETLLTNIGKKELML